MDTTTSSGMSSPWQTVIDGWENSWMRWLSGNSDWLQKSWDESPLVKLFPVDPKEICRALIDLTESMSEQPALLEKQLGLLSLDQMRLALWTLRQLGGEAVEAPMPTPSRDRRFDDDDWVNLLPFSVLRQSYLIWSKWLSDTVTQSQENEHVRQRLNFYLRQWTEALSPSNFALTNPVVLRETIDSGGENLQRGIANFIADAERGAISLTPADRYRPGNNLALTPGTVVFRNELMELIQYKPKTRRVHPVPLLILPPWINRYYVLDMRPGMSLVEFLVAQGHTVFMVSWKNPSAQQAGTTLEDYLKLGALAAIKAAKSISSSRKLNLVGYCIGGTLLGITLAYFAARGDRSVSKATFLTSLLDFSDVGEAALFVSEEKLAEVQQRMEAKGFLAPDELSAVFRLMRGNDLIWNFVVNNYLLGREPPEFDLMHWSVDGTRLPKAMQEYYLYNMYARNYLSMPGKLHMLDTPIDLSRVCCPTYVVAGGDDHIVPWKTAFRSAQLMSGSRRFVLGKAGHVTAVICPAGSRRARYQVGEAGDSIDAETWLQTESNSVEGSWWPDWNKWLLRDAGERISPPTIGNKKYPPLEPAPGRYVLEQ
jgi:polyhydroxyalkanoate synthase